MFFFLSKTLGYLAMPLVWITLLMVLSLFVKKEPWKRRLLIASLSFLLFFSNDFIANELMRAWEVPPTPLNSISQTYQYGIVLTGVTRNDFEPADRVYFKQGADRVVHAVDLYKRGVIRKILISGGEGRLLTKGRREAEDLFTVMKVMGVPEEDMLIEADSRNTHESAVKVAQLLSHVPADSLLLITSAFHMRRSAACFRKAGIDADLFATDFYTHPRYFTPASLLIPSLDALQVWHKLMKEWTGVTAYWLAGYI